MGEYGLKFLLDLYQINNITSIKIVENNLGDEGARYLKEILKINNFIKKLNLFNNNIQNRGIVYLAEALKINNTLTSLNLSANKIGDNGVIALSKSLSFNQSIQKLNLSMNLFGENGTKSLVDMLKNNLKSSLTDIKLDSIKIDQSILNELDKLLNEKKISVKNPNKQVEGSIQNKVEVSIVDDKEDMLEIKENLSPRSNEIKEFEHIGDESEISQSIKSKEEKIKNKDKSSDHDEISLTNQSNNESISFVIIPEKERHVTSPKDITPTKIPTLEISTNNLSPKEISTSLSSRSDLIQSSSRKESFLISSSVSSPRILDNEDLDNKELREFLLDTRMDEGKVEKILQSETEKKQLILMYQMSKSSNATPSNTDIEEMENIISSLTSFYSWMYPTVEETDRLQNLLSAKSISWIKYFLDEKKLLPSLITAISNKEKSRSGKDITVVGNLLRSCYYLLSISALRCKVNPNEIINQNLLRTIASTYVYVQNFNVKTICLENLAVVASTKEGYALLKASLRSEFYSKIITTLIACDDSQFLCTSLDFLIKFIFHSKDPKNRNEVRRKFEKYDLNGAISTLKSKNDRNLKAKIVEYESLYEKDFPKQNNDSKRETSSFNYKSIDEQAKINVTDSIEVKNLKEENIELSIAMKNLENELNEQKKINEELMNTNSSDNKRGSVFDLYSEMISFKDTFVKFSESNSSFSETEKNRLIELIESKMQLSKQVSSLHNENIKYENELNEYKQNQNLLHTEKKVLNSRIENMKEEFKKTIEALQSQKYELLRQLQIAKGEDPNDIKEDSQYISIPNLSQTKSNEINRRSVIQVPKSNDKLSLIMNEVKSNRVSENIEDNFSVGDNILNDNNNNTEFIPPPPIPGGDMPPPPPPGGMGLKLLTPKKVVKPSKKLKVFNWQVLTPVNLGGTIWTELSQDEALFDKEKLEEIFQTKPSLPSTSTSKRTMSTVRKASVLDEKRSNHINITLSKFKSYGGYSKIKEGILSLDPKLLTEDNIQSLLSISPNQEEINNISLFEGERSELGTAEQFCLEMMEISKLKERLEQILFVTKFERVECELRPDIEAVKNASISLKNSKNFSLVLNIILSIGNYINGGTFRGNAMGFNLSTLTVLTDLKGDSDQKLSLMDFIAETISNKYSELANFHEDFSFVQHASNVSLPDLTQEMNFLKNGFQFIEDVVQKFWIVKDETNGEGINENEMTYLTYLSDFVLAKKEVYVSLNKIFEEMSSVFSITLNFFAFDHKTTPNQFFCANHPVN
eukprot:TRINITY_DN6553_c0_g1_i1.p1 TRINITY_DN6553_c0_g1~~TRINITY_DN6553_c0_g1_i1.p1  ORF type:complete len:1306 (-),score=404.33 TRINITY_DN6553_c0_g1_i1:50-3841(-)